MDRIDAILALLHDDDPAVQESLLNRLGADPTLLDRTWLAATATSAVDVPPPALVQMVLRADAEALVDAFADADDLEAGVWLLPRLHGPRSDYRTAGAAALDALAERVRAAGAAENGATIAEFLGGQCGFAGDHDDYDNPLNTFMPWVLERRCGLPIVLTVLWLLMGRRLQVDIQAIAMPGHVLGRWPGGYLDLFEGGRMVTREELDARIRVFSDTAQPYLAPAGDRALLRRMARNLTHAYLRREDAVRATIAHGLATC